MLGIDYAWTHPAPAAIAAAGYGFACRYLSRDPSKNLTRAEADALASAGLWIVANWEFGAQDALKGHAGGVADATLALAQATAAGMPKGRPVYFSVDWDVTPAQEPTVLDYLAGAASVLGQDQTGEYGGYYPIKTAHDAGYRWTWQTGAWSSGQWGSFDTVRQTGSATVGGVQVDTNEAMVPDIGQWQPGRVPQTGDEMTPQEIATIINGVRDQILNHSIGEIDLTGKPTGTTITLGEAVARSRALGTGILAKPAASIDETTAASIAGQVVALQPKSFTVSPVTGVHPINTAAQQ